MPQPHLQTPPVDDIAKVLGRFHAWSSRQSDTLGTALSDGVRESSYEEALAARSMKRQGEIYRSGNSSSMAGAKAAAEVASAEQIHAREIETGTAVKRIVKERAKKKPAKTSGLSKKAAEVKSAAARNEVPADKNAGVGRRQASTQVPASSTEASGSFREAISSYLDSSRNAAFPARVGTVARESVATSTATTTPLENANSSFEFLVQASRNAQSAARVDQPEARSISLNIRVTPAEQALLKAGAEEAGVSVAAYVRQCTFEIEALRLRLNQAVADLRSVPMSSLPTALPLPVSQVSAMRDTKRSGIVSWMMRFWSGRRIAFTA